MEGSDFALSQCHNREPGWNKYVSDIPLHPTQTISWIAVKRLEYADEFLRKIFVGYTGNHITRYGIQRECSESGALSTTVFWYAYLFFFCYRELNSIFFQRVSVLNSTYWRTSTAVSFVWFRWNGRKKLWNGYGLITRPVDD